LFAIVFFLFVMWVCFGGFLSAKKEKVKMRQLAETKRKNIHLNFARENIVLICI